MSNSINKIIVAGHGVVFDITDTTATPETVANGFKFYDKNGQLQTGIADFDVVKKNDTKNNESAARVVFCDEELVNMSDVTAYPSVVAKDVIFYDRNGRRQIGEYEMIEDACYYDLDTKEFHFFGEPDDYFENLVKRGEALKFNWSNTGDFRPWSDSRIVKDCTNVRFDESCLKIKPKSCHSWFTNFVNCEIFRNLEYLDTSNVSSFSQMFRNCQKPPIFDVETWDTSSATDMSYMFADCENLRTVTFRNWHTSNVTNFSYMFCNCGSLAGFDFTLTDLDVSSAETLASMFGNCTDLTSIDLSPWNTQNVESMSGMFAGCSSLERLLFRNFNMSKCFNLEHMFRACTKLRVLDVNFSNATKFAWCYGIFQGCESLEMLDLHTWNTPELEETGRMFYGCSNLKTIYVSDKFNVDNVESSSDMFKGCESIEGAYNTVYDSEHVDKSGACIDKGGATWGVDKGYFTEYGIGRKKSEAPSITPSETPKSADDSGNIAKTNLIKAILELTDLYTEDELNKKSKKELNKLHDKLFRKKN